MKRIPALKQNFLTTCLAAGVLGLAALAPVAGADDAIVRTTSGVNYVSGGIGLESIDKLNVLAKDFNLKLVFALTSGAYLSDVAVAITNPAGKTLLTTTSDGPWFFTKLPAGNYTIVATFAGTAVTRQAAVGAATLRVIHMRWASE